jgi:hypothetical protein
VQWTSASGRYQSTADDKKNARLVIAQIIIDTFKGLQMAYPKITPERQRELEQIRKTLSASIISLTRNA